MKITVLGSGSAYSSLGRFNSCYYVEAGDEKCLIDCGSDAMRAMQKSGIDFFSVKDIFITHMHADHSAGLPAVLTAMHVMDRKDDLRVYIPFPQLEFARSWFANMFVYNGRMSFNIHLVPLNPGKIVLGGGVELEFVPTSHLEKYSRYAEEFGVNPVSFSVVVKEGAKQLFFSSDLASLDEVKGILDGGVSILEATHPALEEVAALAGEKRADLYFTHIPMELEEGGEWRKELASKFGITKLNAVDDGQVIIV